MTRNDHARILSAYLTRLPMAHLAAIVEAERAAWVSQSWEPMGAQMKAQDRAREAVLAAINSMLDHDIKQIEEIAFNQSGA
jgi:cytochrome P450